MTVPADVLCLQTVSKRYRTAHGELAVLRDVNLSIRPGEFVAITGPSGSGKSTFLNLAGLLDRPSAGRLLFEGRDVTAEPDDALSDLRKTRIGMVFQGFNLLPHRTSLENVAFRYRYVDTDPREPARRASEVLDRLGLGPLAGQPVRLLSGGEMQRVAIARAVALRPALLLADEPTGNLDHQSARIVMETFRNLNAEGITIVLATHNLGLLEFCSRHVVCADGALREKPA